MKPRSLKFPIIGIFAAAFFQSLEIFAAVEVKVERLNPPAADSETTRRAAKLKALEEQTHSKGD